MKKTYAVFIIFTIALLGFIYTQSARINSDIFSLVDIKQGEIFKKLQLNSAQNVNILAPNLEVVKRLEILNNELKIFSKIFYKLDDLNSFKKELNLAKIALFKGEINDEFFKSALNSIYSPISVRVLSVGDDLLNLSAQNSLLSQESNITLDLKSGLFKTKDNGYIYVRATLDKNYSTDALLKIYDELKKDGAVVTAAAIFAAFGKKQGESESVKIGILGSALGVCFLFLVFRNFNIFYLFIPPIFGLLCGLSACFLFFESVHIFSLIISTSLVGLMLDFGMSWLGLNHDKKLTRKSIKSVLGIFLLALIISVSGYLLFLFSPMHFLHQIAIFSVFGLLGAFVASYFLLPKMLKNLTFKQSQICERFINYVDCLTDLIFKALKKPLFYCAISMLCLFFGYEIYKSDFKDDIKNYASNPPELIEDARKFALISGVSADFKLIKFNGSQENLLSELRQKGLIKKANSLFNIINTPLKQDEIKAKFRDFSDSDEILKIFGELEIKDELLKLANSPTLSPNELRNFKILSEFDLMFDNPDVIFIDGARADSEFFEILKKFNAQYFDLVNLINENFTQIKQNAIYLKIYGFGVGFMLLLAFVGVKKSIITLGVSLFCAIFTLGLFAIFSDINIFVIFGVILASAVGIDYILFALKKAPYRAKILGVSLAALTSVISFSVLALSKTHAIFSFGASVSVAIILNMLCAFVLVKLRL